MEFGAFYKKTYRGRWARRAILAAGVVGLMLNMASCGESPGYSYTIGGVVSGMAGGGLVLRNNGADALTVNANGAFTFSRAVPDGAAYNVTIATQPAGVNQRCVVVNGSGAISGAIVSVRVNCVQTPDRFTVDSASAVTLAGAIDYGNNKITPFTVAESGALDDKTKGDTGTNPNAITVEDVGGLKIAYVTNFDAATNAGTISVYSIATDGTGALTTIQSGVSAGQNPFSVTVADIAASKYAYVPDWSAKKIYVYSVNLTTGALSATPVQTVDTGLNPHSITIRKITISSVDYYIAYATNAGDNTLWTYTINTTNGNLNAQGSSVTAGVNPGSVLVDSSGKYAYVTSAGSNSISSYTIDQTTEKLGTLTPGTIVGTGSNPINIFKDQDGAFIYVPNFRSNSISVYTIGADGSLSTGTAVGTGTNPYAVATVKITVGSTIYKYAYAVNYNSNNVSMYRIDTTSGALTEITGSPVTAGTNPYAIKIAKTTSGSNVYAVYVLNAGSGNISTYAIENTTGVLSPVAGSPFVY